ncbi:MAG TPA: DNA starvation/stationary phase protection protein Dps [Trueperaceae bacterium]|nr:DNA starvation/stationary phase protection protein Dps [Trueperaceae bacterium]
MAATATKEKLHATKIDLPEKARRDLVALCNQALADAFDLYSQAKQAHWNVKGMDFHQLHELFDEVADAVLPFADQFAERAATLGGVALGTVRLAAKASQLKEYPAGLTKGQDHVEAVRDRLAAWCGALREAIGKAEDLGDPTTADLFTEASRVADLQLYFVESHLQG